SANATRPTRIEILAMGMEMGLYGWLVGGCFMDDQEVDPAYWFAALTVVLTRLHRRQRQATDEEAMLETTDAGTDGRLEDYSADIDDPALQGRRACHVSQD